MSDVSTNGNVLEATGVTKRFGGLVAVNDVDFVVPHKSIVAIIGPNGAGKTTFFNCMTGLYKPTTGRSCSTGADITAKAPHIVTQAGHRAHVPEHQAVQDDDGARERAWSGATARMKARITGSIFHTPFVRREERETEEHARELLKRRRHPAPPPGPRGQPARTATSAGSRSRVRWPRTRSCCCSTSRRRA